MNNNTLVDIQLLQPSQTHIAEKSITPNVKFTYFQLESTNINVTQIVCQTVTLNTQ